MATNIALLRKRRDEAELFQIKWEATLARALTKFRTYRRKVQRYNREIEKALAKQAHLPKDPTRVVEV